MELRELVEELEYASWKLGRAAVLVAKVAGRLGPTALAEMLPEAMEMPVGDEVSQGDCAAAGQGPERDQRDGRDARDEPAGATMSDDAIEAALNGKDYPHEFEEDPDGFDAAATANEEDDPKAIAIAEAELAAEQNPDGDPFA